MQTKQRPWWLTLINGILALVIGLLLLFGSKSTQAQTILLLVSFLGFYWLFRGIFDIVYLFVDHTAWGWKLFTGIIGIIAGGYILAYPIASALALPRIFVLVLGIWGLMEGIVLLIMAFQGGGWAAGILGVLGIVLGVVLIANYSAPGMGLSMLWAGAVLAVIGGIVLIFQAFRQRSA
jgi:uncharacterized membrane protein HdeD (DUF308 family)